MKFFLRAIRSIIGVARRVVISPQWSPYSQPPTTVGFMEIKVPSSKSRYK